jgi:hypothetical protein
MSNEGEDITTIGEADSLIVATTDPDREIDQALVDRLLEQAGHQDLELLGEGGLLQQLTKQVLETALDTELTEHLVLRTRRSGGPWIGQLTQRHHPEEGPDRYRRGGS